MGGTMKHSKTSPFELNYNKIDMRYAVGIAVRDIWRHKGRYALAALGLILGLAFLISIAGISQGRADSEAVSQSAFKANTMHVEFLDKDQTKMVTYEEMKILQAENSEAISYMVPHQTKQMKMKFGTKASDTTLVGTTPDYLRVSRVSVKNGKFMNRFDVDNRRKVMILGSFSAKNLFGEDNPVGKEVKLDNQVFSVIGVLEQMADSEFSSVAGSADDVAIIPYGAGRTLFDSAQVDRYVVGAKRTGTMENAEEVINDYLLEHYRRPTLYSITRDVNSDGGALPVPMLLLTALLTFLIGGIMVLSSLNVSIAERKQELVVRRMAGASRLDLLIQFFVEGVTVALAGGVGGVVLGSVITITAGAFLHFNAFPHVLWLIGALVFSAVTGLVFSISAAKTAAREEIEAWY